MSHYFHKTGALFFFYKCVVNYVCEACHIKYLQTHNYVYILQMIVLLTQYHGFYGHICWLIMFNLMGDNDYEVPQHMYSETDGKSRCKCPNKCYR